MLTDKGKAQCCNLLDWLCVSILQELPPKFSLYTVETPHRMDKKSAYDCPDLTCSDGAALVKYITALVSPDLPSWSNCVLPTGAARVGSFRLSLHWRRCRVDAVAIELGDIQFKARPRVFPEVKPLAQSQCMS
jgi:hypothetical protein